MGHGKGKEVQIGDRPRRQRGEVRNEDRIREGNRIVEEHMAGMRSQLLQERKNRRRRARPAGDVSGKVNNLLT